MHTRKITGYPGTLGKAVVVLQVTAKDKKIQKSRFPFLAKLTGIRTDPLAAVEQKGLFWDPVGRWRPPERPQGG